MRKILLASTAILMLSACSPHYSRETDNYMLPPELADCKIFSLSTGTHGIKAIRCPNSNTSSTYSVGKSKHSTMVDASDNVPPSKEECLNILMGK